MLRGIWDRARMLLDGYTVLFDTTLLAATCGGLLAYSATRRGGDRSLAYWGAAYLIGGVSALLFSQRGIWPNVVTLNLANMTVDVAYGLCWAGARRFARKPIPVWTVLAGAVAWTAATAFDAFLSSVPARIVLQAAIAAVYFGAIAVELAALREPLPSRWPLAGLFAFHALIHVARVPTAFFGPATPGQAVVVTPMFVFVTAESLVHLVASSLLFVTMSRERAENVVQRLACVDPLTGVANRRAFLEEAAHRLLGASSQRPMTLLMIDIDHFKRVNDTLGHQAGDEVLRAVAAALQTRLRPQDLCGRFGGEEFVCLLPDCDAGEGRVIAERLREAVGEIAGAPVTISVGVASTRSLAAAPSIERLLFAADHALYCSKREGRDRVTLALAA